MNEEKEKKKRRAGDKLYSALLEVKECIKVVKATGVKITDENSLESLEEDCDRIEDNFVENLI